MRLNDSSPLLCVSEVLLGAAIGHVKMIVVAAGLMLSGAMALPMSSFPNVMSLPAISYDRRITLPPFPGSNDFV